MKAVGSLLFVVVLTCVANGQLATGGGYTLEKSVVAGGGGAGSAGSFQAGSTTGQTVAGPQSGGPFSIYSGFWSPDQAPTPTGPCPFGQGYWKNTPTVWPAESLVLGDETYSKSQLLTLLNTPSGSGKKADASLILAYQLIAAKLNVANGVDPSPLGTAISDADALLAPYNGKIPYKVMSQTGNGQAMIALALQLESFNKGLLTHGCQPVL